MCSARMRNEHSANDVVITNRARDSVHMLSPGKCDVMLWYDVCGVNTGRDVRDRVPSFDCNKKNALGSVSIVYTASSTINKLKDKAVILLFFQHDLHLNAITRRHCLNVYTRAYVIVLGVRNSPRLVCVN